MISSELFSMTFLGVCLLSFFQRSIAAAQFKKQISCYTCFVQDGCLTLDIYAENATKKCDPGVEHCVVSRTESKVTGAIALDHMCGGIFYEIEEDSSLKDGCFEGVDDPGARTKRTVCYCSYDLCNNGFRTTFNVSLLLLLFTFFWVFR